jgi:hypothetical protein
MILTINPAAASAVDAAIQRTGAPIWENLYEMKVAYLDTISAERIKESGIPTTGNKLLNRQMHQDWVNVVIKIDDMVEYFKRGVTVVFRRHNDTREVYDIVNNYLLAWRAQVDNGLNLGNVPVEDLMLLDRFAETLYPVALQFGAAPRNTGSLFANFFKKGNGQFLARGELFAPIGEDGKPQPEQPEKHTPHAGELAKSIARLSSKW